MILIPLRQAARQMGMRPKAALTTLLMTNTAIVYRGNNIYVDQREIDEFIARRIWSKS